MLTWKHPPTPKLWYLYLPKGTVHNPKGYIANQRGGGVLRGRRVKAKGLRCNLWGCEPFPNTRAYTSRCEILFLSRAARSGRRFRGLTCWDRRYERLDISLSLSQGHGCHRSKEGSDHGFSRRGWCLRPSLAQGHPQKTQVERDDGKGNQVLN